MKPAKASRCVDWTLTGWLLPGRAAFERPVSVLSKEGLAEREAARARRPSPAAARCVVDPKSKPQPSRQHSISSRAGPLPGIQPAPCAAGNHSHNPTTPYTAAHYAELLAAAEKVAAEAPGAARTPYAAGGPAGGPAPGPFWAVEDGAHAHEGVHGASEGVEAVVVYPDALRRRQSGAGSSEDGCMSTARSQIIELAEFLGIEEEHPRGPGAPMPGALGPPVPGGLSPSQEAAHAHSVSGIGRWWAGMVHAEAAVPNPTQEAPPAHGAGGLRHLWPRVAGAGLHNPNQGAAPASAAARVGRWWAGVEARVRSWAPAPPISQGAAAAGGRAKAARGLALPFQPLTLAFKDISYSVELPKVRGCLVWQCQPATFRLSCAQ